MENRERDRVSQSSTPTEAGDRNRETSAKEGREKNSGTSAEFGQKIGRAEELEGGAASTSRDEGTDSSETSDTGQTGSSQGRH